jgi:hypothetical protein
MLTTPWSIEGRPPAGKRRFDSLEINLLKVESILVFIEAHTYAFVGVLYPAYAVNSVVTPNSAWSDERSRHRARHANLASRGMPYLIQT